MKRDPSWALAQKIPDGNGIIPGGCAPIPGGNVAWADKLPKA